MALQCVRGIEQTSQLCSVHFAHLVLALRNKALNGHLIDRVIFVVDHHAGSLLQDGLSGPLHSC